MVMPVGPLIFVLTLDAATHAFGTLFTGLVIIARASSELNLNWNAFNVVILVLMVGFGTMIYVAVNLITATLSFWFVGSRTSIMFMVQRFRDFASYPLPIYAVPIQVLMTWIVPFAFAGFFPATFFLEQREFSLYVYSIPLVSVVFLGLAYAFWRTGLNAYQSTGS
jgi:ABC-2 type transport system permease protein